MLLWANQKLYKDVPALASSPRAKEVYNTSNDTYSEPVPFLGRNWVPYNLVSIPAYSSWH